MNQVLFAKQPILDRNQHVIANELLYRNNQATQNASEVFDDNIATAQVIVSALNQSYFYEEKELVFINFAKDLLFTPPPFERHDHIVIEILETVKVDDELIEQVKVLKKLGYKIALDDYQGDEHFSELLPLMDIIKVEVLGISDDDLSNLVINLKQYTCKLLAEKVEDQSMFDQCLKLGFDYFQGFFFSKPINITGEKIGQNQSSLLRLMGKIHKPDVSLNEISLLVSQDPSLCTGLLKIVNSPLFKRENTINSIQQACSLLGVVELKNWVQLLSFAKLDDRPDMFHFQSLLNALFMKSISQNIDAIDHDEAFTVGICAHLETIMNLPIEVIVDQLPFDQKLKDALTLQKGDLGKLLQFCLFYIEGRWDQLDWKWLKHNMKNDEELPKLYEQAYSTTKHAFV